MDRMKADILLAMKAINLSPSLTGTQKRVACAVLDHRNRRTGRCDPSLNRIADLLGVSRRTVIRAVNQLVQLGLFHRERFGGLYHKNSYEPIWSRFREMEELWKARTQAAKKNRRASNLSPFQRQDCHIGGDTGATQTCLTNQSSSTCLRGDVAVQGGGEASFSEKKRQPSEVKSSRSFPRRFHVKQSTHDVAMNAAERRWLTSLQATFVGESNLYAQIIEAIDLDMRAAATSAELNGQGAGLELIINELQHLLHRTVAK